MATPDVDDQLTTLRTRLGEPEDEDQARWSPEQLLAQLIASRNEIAEKTYCYPVKDSIDFTTAGSLVAPVSQALPTVGTPFLISTVNDFIWLRSLTWNGRPLRLVRPDETWEDVIGDDDTMNGDPLFFMFFGPPVADISRAARRGHDPVSRVGVSPGDRCRRHRRELHGALGGRCRVARRDGAQGQRRAQQRA
jgi:hypothetical protein